tara:strand:- start:695 stop:2137 length:1443 start_codon:yes stop_codon:yes gene_type:complete
MTEENTDAITSAKLPIRIGGIEIEEGAWPCSADFLERHKEIENLTPVLINAKSPVVVGIDAPWGGGKSTFIDLWRCYLSQADEKYESIYLNAWESDFSEDPLLPLLAQIDRWFSSRTDESNGKRAWKAAKRFAPALLKGTAVAATKAATFGAVDLDAEFEQLAAELTGGAVGSLVDSYKVRQASMDKFRELLEESLTCLPENQYNLIIFVDELDRCKPTYAVMMLECIKHLFSIEGIVFVLAINSDQLIKSFQGVYGPGFDGASYLKRFIDLDYQLMAPDIQKYIALQVNQPDIRADFSGRQHGSIHLDALKKTIQIVAPRFNYQLRDVNQLVTRLRLILRSIPQNHHLDPVVLGCLLMLRDADRELYLKYIENPFLANDVIECLTGVTPESTDIPEDFGSVAGWIFKAGYDGFTDIDFEPTLQPWINLAEKLPENDRSVRELTRMIGMARDSQNAWDRSNLRKTAFERIELMHRMDVSR